MMMMKKKKTQAEMDAEVVRFRMLSAAMQSLSTDEQVEVIEDAMKSGRTPVPAKIQFN
jgi:hypothetical protein